MQKERQFSLDILKVMATIFIVFHHYQQITGTHLERFNFYGGWIYFGNFVEFFFILSGYFMYHYVEKIGNSSKDMNFKDFIFQRISRLLPYSAISVIVFEILAYMYFQLYGDIYFYHTPSIWGTIIAILGIQAGWVFKNPLVNNPTWYISVLILCYIIFYILTYIAKKKDINPCYLYIIMIFVGIGIHTYNIELPFLNYQSARGYFSFFYGLIFARYLETHRLGKKTYIGCSVIIVALIYFLSQEHILVSQDVEYLMTFLFFPALIILFLSNPVKKMCRYGWIGTLSKISFHVYIWHMPAHLFLCVIFKLFGWNIGFQSGVRMILFTLGCFAIGAFSYYFIEKPITQWLRLNGFQERTENQ